MSGGDAGGLGHRCPGQVHMELKVLEWENHIASPTQNVLHSALALASLNWGTRPSVHCARCKACGLAAVKFCCAVLCLQAGCACGSTGG